MTATQSGIAHPPQAIANKTDPITRHSFSLIRSVYVSCAGLFSTGKAVFRSALLRLHTCLDNRPHRAGLRLQSGPRDEDARLDLEIAGVERRGLVAEGDALAAWHLIHEEGQRAFEAERLADFDHALDRSERHQRPEHVVRFFGLERPGHAAVEEKVGMEERAARLAQSGVLNAAADR